jgi:Flp pilus assembly protein TadD
LANFPDHARSAWEQAIRIDPRLLEPRRRRAVQMFDQRPTPEALTALEEVYHDNPWDRAVAGRLILARAAAGRDEAAFELAQQAVARFPDAAQLHRWLADACRTRGRPTEASRHAGIAEALDRPWSPRGDAKP